MQYTPHGYPYPIGTDPAGQIQAALAGLADRMERDTNQPSVALAYDGAGNLATVTERAADGTVVRTTTFTWGTGADAGFLASSAVTQDGRTETSTFTYGTVGSSRVLTGIAVAMS